MTDQIEEGIDMEREGQEKPLKVLLLTSEDYPGCVAIHRVYSDKTTVSILGPSGKEELLVEGGNCKSKDIKKAPDEVSGHDVFNARESIINLAKLYLKSKGIGDEVIMSVMNAIYMEAVYRKMRITRGADRAEVIREMYTTVRTDIAWLSRQIMQSA